MQKRIYAWVHMADADKKSPTKAGRYRYFRDQRIESLIALAGGALIILAMVAVTLR